MERSSLKNKKIISLLIFLIYLGCIFLIAQKPPKQYVAYTTTDHIEVDGKMEELAWKSVPWSDDFIDIEGYKKPLYKTNMKMLWDSEYLYFFAQMEEPHVWATLKQRDTVIFYNNDFEIFIDPDGDTHNYMEFEMNALNTVWDLFLTKPYRNHGKVLDSWDIQGIKTAAYIDGTINNSKDTDEGWNVEIAIPWQVLKEANTHNNLPENEFWRIGFSRVNWKFELLEGKYSRKKDDEGKYLPEYNWVWSPQWVVNMHEPEKWGYVYFSTGEAGAGTDFEIPKDEHIKWYLYELYRDFISKEKSEVEWETCESQIFVDTKKIFGKSIKVRIDVHESGFNIWTRSPFTKRKLVIREDGQFLSFGK